MSFARVLCLSIIIFVARTSFAYPSYAARFNINSCSACHWSPVGGGPRTREGKLFGAHGFHLAPWQTQDFFSADFRALDVYPQRVSSSKGGAGVMSASIAGHAALDEEGRIRLVIEDNVGGFSAAPLRDTYALFKFFPDEKPHAFESVLAGRFRPPFGVVTDEHRTYTRIQTATEWFTFETGAMLSGSFHEGDVHYDVALVNGQKNPGNSLGTGQATLWGSIVNARWMWSAVMLGTSGQYHRAKTASQSRSALSLYAVWSLARATQNRWPVTLTLEHTSAWGWDSNLGRGFASDPDYVNSLDRSVSHGWLAMVEWALSDQFTCIYKLDELTPDREFPADYYIRHGFGFRWFFGPGTSLLFRTELARATPPSEKGGTQEGAQDATFAILELEI